MMIKIAVVFCAVLATSMVSAKTVEEQALDNLLNLMLSEEASSPEDNVALQGWFSNAFKKVKHVAKQGLGAASGACKTFGYSPEEAHAKILEAYPELRDAVSEENVGNYCAGAHALNGLVG